MCRRTKVSAAHTVPTPVAKVVHLSGFGSFGGMECLKASLLCAVVCICVVFLIGATLCRASAYFTASKVSAMLVVIYHVILVVIFQASIFARPLVIVPVAIGQLEARRATTKNNMYIFHQVLVARERGISELFHKSAA